MGNWKETYRGVVFPWHCDQFGHMNVRWYGHFFDDAAFQIWTVLGHGFKKMEDDGVHTVIAKSSIEFIHELCAGDLFVIETGFISFGEQWEYTVVHYAMHHPSLNDGTKDSECPADGHVASLPKGWWGRLVLLLTSYFLLLTSHISLNLPTYFT